MVIQNNCNCATPADQTASLVDFEDQLHRPFVDQRRIYQGQRAKNHSYPWMTSIHLFGQGERQK